jgi:hypothetical protein
MFVHPMPAAALKPGPLFFIMQLICVKQLSSHTIPHHTSHITRPTPNITHRTSHITHHTSNIKHHTSHITHHTPHITHHTSQLSNHIVKIAPLIAQQSAASSALTYTNNIQITRRRNSGAVASSHNAFFEILTGFHMMFCCRNPLQKGKALEIWAPTKRVHLQQVILRITISSLQAENQRRYYHASEAAGLNQRKQMNRRICFEIEGHMCYVAAAAAAAASALAPSECISNERRPSVQPITTVITCQLEQQRLA